MRRARALLVVAAVAAIVFGAAPAVLLWRARTIRHASEREARKTGAPIEDSLPAVLARIAAHSPWARAAHREESRFWLSMARSGEAAERHRGPTRRNARRIARAYSDAIRADAGLAAPDAVRRLNARSRFDLSGRKRGAALERALARELGLARALSGAEPGPCDAGLDAAVRRFAAERLEPSAPVALASMTAALALAAQGHDDRALAALARDDGAAASVAKALVLLRAGRSREAELAAAAALGRPDAAPLRVVAMTARALARLGMQRADDALLAIGADGQPAFAGVRIVASFVTGDTAGARAALRRIPDRSTLRRLRDGLAPALVAWSESRRAEGRTEVARIVSALPDDWDLLVPFGRYAAGHLDDLEAWLELSGPRDRLARVWQLYALERAARERHNEERGDELAALRRRICRR